MGMNLGGEVYYSATNIYKDLMRSADPWKTADKNGTRWENDIYFHDIPSRLDGYPTHVPFFVPDSPLPQFLESPISAGGKQPSGLHHVFFKGDGEFTIFGAKLIEEHEKGHHTYLFPEHESEHVLRITRSEKANPIRDIAVVHDSYVDNYKTQPFNPDLFRSLDSPSVIRLMDLMFTNGNAAISGQHATPMDYYTWNSCPEACDANHFSGHPPEILMQLSNEIDAHPWLTFGHKAEDDYIRQYARKVKQHLNKDKYVFIEYSNELWNWMFPQAQWIAKVGCKHPATKVLHENGECDGIASGRRYQTKRSLEILSIFKEVFDDERHRVKGVLAGQGSWAYQAELALQALADPKINPNKQLFDILAIAPYFGGEAFDSEQKSEAFKQASFTELRDQAISMIDSVDVRGGVKQHKLLANHHGLDLWAYEGGQHYVCHEQYCDDQTFMNKLYAFQRHPVMEEIYRYYYNMWFEEGGSVFAAFSHMGSVENKWGSWGTSEYYGQPLSDAPKRRAYIRAAETYRFE
jgi:hypothetical protein